MTVALAALGEGATAPLGFMNIRKVVALNLRRYRRAQRVSQEELAHRAEIDRTYVSSIERCV